ncbi:MAG TPA: TonB-dependent receptor [Burkholderiaceae bacterium]|nr:TonB-dependent receptor [Burkholderiaceae bacterium]
MPMPTPNGRVSLAALALLLDGSAAYAQATTPTPTTTLPTVTVTSTRVETPAFDVPASIDRIGAETIRDQRAQINISESLAGVPGLLARDRQNYAQDVQLSVRGFGARASFGIRGVRLYVDGIPATLPDGQGQISNVELGSTDRIEVLRGPFSALYGNSSGGVVNVYTEEGRGPPTVSASVAAGSDALRRIGVRASGSNGVLGYVVGASRFTTDGYRDHSETDRRLGNVKLTIAPDGDGKLTLIANSVALPQAQDPLGLTRAQFEADPRSVDPSALAFDTRKTVEQTQAGAIYERRVDDANALRLLAYYGHRGTDQYQAIPVAPQNSPLHPGGVIALARNYQGVDARWTFKGRLADAPLTLVGGLAYDSLIERRQGFQNFVGSGASQVLGVRGALRRDEQNTVIAVDPYAQASWQFAPRWTLQAGVRRSTVRFDSRDAYIVGTNPDDSGSARYSATLPVVSLMFAPNEDLRVYASAGRGFETPTLNELAYRPGGGTGLNFALNPSHSTNLELGLKLRNTIVGDLNAAVFEIRTDDELVTLSNVGGRTTYQNAGATRRSGLELAWSTSWFENNLRAQAAATWLDARYRDGFATCTVTPCTTPNLVIPDGNRLPGIARASLFASLGWLPAYGWRGGIELRALSRVAVNDANSDAAPPYAVVNASVGYGLRAGAWELSAFVRGDNLFDRRYAGSVIVNEANGRYFEPAPGRTWLAGTTASYTF